MQGEVGLTYDTKRKKFYVFKCWKIKPNYFGSNIQIKRATKTRPGSLIKLQLATSNSYKNLNMLEKYFISLFDAVNNPNFYNVAVGGEGGNTHAGWSLSRKQQYSSLISNITKSRGQRPLHVRQKISNTLKGHFVSDDTKLKQSLVKKGKIPLCAKNRLKSVTLQNIKTNECIKFKSFSDAGRYIEKTSSLVHFLSKNKDKVSKNGWKVISND